MNEINNEKIKSILLEVSKELKIIEKESGKKFGDSKKPFINFCKIWSQSINARNDGYGSKFRTK